jgi:nucleotide-binding universal stress UspA family protein
LRAIHVFGSDAVAPTAWAPGAYPAVVYLAPAGAQDSTRSEIQLAFDSLQPSIGWLLEFCEGPIDPAVIERSESADALVLGTREHIGIDRVLNGSVSHYCLGHAGCPVIAVPPSSEIAGAETF